MIFLNIGITSTVPLHISYVNGKWGLIEGRRKILGAMTPAAAPCTTVAYERRCGESSMTV